jgi:tRNA(Ile)-lysidine synthase
MAHSAHSAPMDMLRAAVQRGLDAHVPAGAPIAVALSGGRDSVVLFDALLQVAPARDHRVSALHVHHGLSRFAAAWQRFCEDLCAERNVALSVRAIDVPRAPQHSLESEARRLRYAALTEMASLAGVAFVALAHHRDDQAETLLLQLLRGAGPHGLAGMRNARVDARGVTLLRPLLDVSREVIDAYAIAAQLRWVDDESNVETRHLRNAVRHTLMPVLAGMFPNPSVTLARAAAHQSEAALLADDVAVHDALAASDGATLDRAVLAALAPYRARNLLRWFLRQQGLPAPSSARLAAMIEQLGSARSDANVCLAHGGVELGVHRGRVVIHAKPPPSFDLRWQGESELVLPHGRLVIAHADGEGLDARRLAQAPVHVRSRVGGERLQLAANRPRRALKSILQEAGMPAWERRALPLVYCGEALVAAPGIGIDEAFHATPGSAGITLSWHPDACAPRTQENGPLAATRRAQ